MPATYDLPLPQPPAPLLRRFGPRPILSPITGVGLMQSSDVVQTASPAAPLPAAVTPEAINVDPALYEAAAVEGGRVVAAPSEDASSDARAMLARIVDRIGGSDVSAANTAAMFHMGAQMRADREQGDYQGRVDRHNETTTADQQQAAMRALTEAERQRRNVIRMTAVNNPAGAAAAAEGELAYSLISPQARDRIGRLQESQIAENNAQAARAGSSGGGGGTGAADRQAQRLSVQEQGQVNRSHDTLDAAERTARERFLRIREQYQNNPLSFGATPEEQQQRLRAIEQERDTTLGGIAESRQRLPPRGYVTVPGAAPGAHGTPSAASSGGTAPAPTAAPGEQGSAPAAATAEQPLQRLPPVNERVVGRTYNLPAGRHTWGGPGVGWQPVR